MTVFISNAKLHVSAYIGHLQVLTTFLLKKFYIICLNRVVMFRSHFCFLVCKYFISSLILIMVTLCCVCLHAGDVLGILIFA